MVTIEHRECVIEALQKRLAQSLRHDFASSNQTNTLSFFEASRSILTYILDFILERYKPRASQGCGIKKET
jgi:hypothetical protein